MISTQGFCKDSCFCFRVKEKGAAAKARTRFDLLLLPVGELTCPDTGCMNASHKRQKNSAFIEATMKNFRQALLIRRRNWITTARLASK
jgi:hypothetical protein